jgi:hypothetical protein
MNNPLNKIIAALAILLAVALIIAPGVIGSSIEINGFKPDKAGSNSDPRTNNHRAN